jgi:hypothetical protein
MAEMKIHCAFVKGGIGITQADRQKRNEFPYGLQIGFLTNESLRKTRPKPKNSVSPWSDLHTVQYRISVAISI